MKYFLLIATLFCSFELFAQEDEQWMEPSKESHAYHTYRSKLTTPPYELAKIKALIANIKDSEDEGIRLSNKVYNSLTLREKFTYHMIHAEAYSQNCDVMPPIQEEDKKIFGNLPDAFDEYSWSERQLNFLQGSRDSVMALIKESATRSKRMGVNYKQAVVAANGWEMIPYLITTYNTDKKDGDILSILLLLMKQNEYQPFMTSSSFSKLYGENADYRAFLVNNTANRALIIERAESFYKSKR